MLGKSRVQALEEAENAANALPYGKDEETFFQGEAAFNEEVVQTEPDRLMDIDAGLEEVFEEEVVDDML